MGNVNFCSNIFRIKKSSNPYFTKKRLSANEDINNEDLYREICTKTNFTRDEIEEWHDSFLVGFQLIFLKDFIKFFFNFQRECPDGKLNKRKFSKTFKQVYSGFGSSKEFCKDVFSSFDKNKNGYIEFDEFIYAIGLSFSKDIRDKIDLAFDVFDRNKDGVISRKEAEKILKVFQLS